MGNSLNSTHLGSPRPSRSTSTQLRKLFSVARRCSLPGRPTNPAMAPNRRTLGLAHIITSSEQTLTDLPLWGGKRGCEVSQSCLTWLWNSSCPSKHSKRMTFQIFVGTNETVKVFILNASRSGSYPTYVLYKQYFFGGLYFDNDNKRIIIRNVTNQHIKMTPSPQIHATLVSIDELKKVLQTLK